MIGFEESQASCMHSRIEQFGQDSSGPSDCLQYDTMVCALSWANNCPIRCVASIADLRVFTGCCLKVGKHDRLFSDDSLKVV